jgi:translation elongation factor EF-Tu-like GTPase|tara:strand:+ start:98 stop:283 length:186 start_codon:yes stop_codon:yes gene_type:complete
VKDIELLNTLEVKIREMVSSLEREREKNSVSEKAVQESEKLSKIEERVRHLITMIDQLEQA